MSDKDGSDIRLEAAAAKMWTSERGWEAIDAALQICGGRAYETADSLKARGADPLPIERMMRDFRINTVQSNIVLRRLVPSPMARLGLVAEVYAVRQTRGARAVGEPALS